ncbi:MAG: hypothetical protein AVO34_10555 [Firmicutes bacterium ML8_F2]|nr:MAG: hypothetical protein AVO34_10555 [Firmicutes bacterium ML8_F2]
MLTIPQQEYVKYLYEKEDFSICRISQTMGINWRKLPPVYSLLYQDGERVYVSLYHLGLVQPKDC